MRIHKEGHVILLSFLVVFAVLNILAFLIFPAGHVFTPILLSFSVIVYLLILWFFRVPRREFRQDANLVIAPADGKIVTIEETGENEYFNDKRLQVSIFMSPVDVHLNLFPIGGLVKYYKYHPGDYLLAWHPKASSKNERCSVVIENSEKNTVLVRQIAGALARRIVCYAKTGESVQQGQELGFIKFGSRVDLFLPTDVKLNVRLGQKVTGKTTVLASFS
jgi:phosphatidylserine decarboxylase